MANIIATGAGAANSADIVLAAGASAIIHGYPTNTGDWSAQLQIKNADATYTTVKGITNINPAATIEGPATYRVARPAGGVAVAIDNG